MNGLNEYDFSARWYDHTLPGFTTPDPLAELHCSESPYSYCGGNPVNRIDPTGMDDDNPDPDSDDYYFPDYSNPDPDDAKNSDGSRFYDHLGGASVTADNGKANREATYNEYCPAGGNQDNSGISNNGSGGNSSASSSSANYGKITGYVSISASFSLGGGLAGEFGYVYTDKNYAQYYISYGTTLGIGGNVNANTGLIFAMPGKNPQLGDYDGSSINGGVSIIPFVSGQGNANQNYVALGASLGVGAKWNERVNGGQGNTILLGSPINMIPEPGFFSNHYNPY